MKKLSKIGSKIGWRREEFLRQLRKTSRIFIFLKNNILPHVFSQSFRTTGLLQRRIIKEHKSGGCVFEYDVDRDGFNVTISKEVMVSKKNQLGLSYFYLQDTYYNSVCRGPEVLFGCTDLLPFCRKMALYS